MSYTLIGVRHRVPAALLQRLLDAGSGGGGSGFRVRFGEAIEADLLLPAPITLAIVLAHQRTLFGAQRQNLLQRCAIIQHEFQQAFVIAVCNDAFEINTWRRIFLEQRDVLPPLIVCTSWDVVVSMLKGLANVFGAARRAHREEKIREIDTKAATSASAMNLVLQKIPGLEEQGQDAKLLQECYGSILRIGNASAKSILDATPCSIETANTVSMFFSDAPQGVPPNCGR